MKFSDLSAPIVNILFYGGLIAMGVCAAWALIEHKGKGRRGVAWLAGVIFCGIGFVVCVLMYFSPEKQMPGLGVYSVIRLYDTPEYRRRYVFDFASPSKSRFSFYLSASSRFTLSVTDANQESYPLEVTVGQHGIPIDRTVVLLCDVGISTRSTTLRIFVNQNEIARRDLPFRLNLGGVGWESAIGKPILGVNQGGVFKLQTILLTTETFSKTEISNLVENARQASLISN